MSTSPRCRLTARDFAHLQELLEQTDPRRDEAYLRLLRSKLSTAIVMFPSDIDPWVAAIGSRIEFTANAGVPQNRILAGEDGNNGRGDPAGRILPVTARWGLALLGLAANETIAVEDGGGTVVRLRLTKVEPLEEPAGANAGGKRDSGAAVVDFAPRAATPRQPLLRRSVDPDNDPGPSAA